MWKRRWSCCAGSAVNWTGGCGRLTALRVYNALEPQYAAKLIAEGPRSAADGRVITRALKFYMDGALGSRGAALFAKYDDAETLGLIKMNQDEVLPVWRAALKRGINSDDHTLRPKGRC